MSIGARLKALRVSRNQSLQDVAGAVQSSKAHIWEIERGGSKNPSMDLLTRLAAHFHVTVSHLVGEDPPSEEHDELIVLYRDLKELGPQDREAIRGLMRHFRDKKADG